LTITINQVFDLSENHFHENGLWTHPPAEDSTENDREQDDKDYGYQKRHNEKVEILGPERLTENIEFSIYDIEKQKLVSVNLDKGRGK
jgi:hypothetical protein